MAAENGTQGKVIVQFVVTKTGKVGEVKVVRSLSADCDNEAKRVVKSLPNFTPGRQSGQAVNVWYTLPVTFKLTKSDSQSSNVHTDTGVEVYPPENSNSNDDRVFTSVEQMPQFPGGDAALMKYLAQHLQYPAMAAENGTQGKVIVQFVVTKTGKVGEVKVVRSLSDDCDKEAIRLIRDLPKFIPGKKNGKPTSMWYTLPVTFKLQQ